MMHSSHAAGEKEALRGHLRSALNTIQNLKESVITPQKGGERPMHGSDYYERRKAAVENFRNSGEVNDPIPQHVSQVRKPSSFDPTGEDRTFQQHRQQQPSYENDFSRDYRSEFPTKTYSYGAAPNNYSFDDTPIAARTAAASPPTGNIAEALNDFLGFQSSTSNSQLTAPKSSLKPTSKYSPQQRPQPQHGHQQQQKIPKQYLTGVGYNGDRGVLQKQLAGLLSDTSKPLTYDELKMLAAGELPTAVEDEVTTAGFGESFLENGNQRSISEPLRLNPSTKSAGDLAIRSNLVSQLVEKQLPYTKNTTAPAPHQTLLSHPPPYENSQPLDALASDLKVLDAKSEQKLTRVGEMLQNKKKVGKR
eukprot:TRINITY_DN8507_c0_g1_i2.p1 TRINITY_DN8507_c0_g1~~TRINITY_DN8507_c0_g1_i2.p1  ORF type:complete len:376 (+),score=74.66 TRINITY_DN8507_c0_g1_i2:40-1128(+)